jgi:hypothetical protein
LLDHGVPVADLRDVVAAGFQHHGDDLPAHRVVLGHEDAQAARACDLPLRGGRAGVPARVRRLAHERDGEPENGAFAGLAVEADRASHQLDEVLADRRSKARSAVLPADPGVRLREPVEDARTYVKAEAHFRAAARRFVQTEQIAAYGIWRAYIWMVLCRTKSMDAHFP